MATNPVQGQMEQLRGQAAQAGFGGSAIIDVHPAQGVIRIKLTLTPADRLPEFITRYVGVLSMTLQAMNIQPRVHEEAQ